MKRLTCTINIGKFQFDFVKDVKIKSSWKKLTDTATIELPRNIKWKDRYLKDEVKKGDQVQIYLGYDFNESLLFSGYIAQVGNGVPVMFECEDEMWKLKQTNITKSWRSINLQQMLKEIVPSGTKYKALNAELGPFRINKVSVAKVLEELKRAYGFVSFFRSGELIVGYPYSQVEPSEATFIFENNIIEDRLEYQAEDDVKIKVRAVSMLAGGGKIEREVGDPDGEEHSLHFYNLGSTELKKAAEEQKKRLVFNGYRGEFTAFGDPVMRHSDQVAIQGYKYPERNGKYLVDEVQTSFGMSGYRQEIKIGPKV